MQRLCAVFLLHLLVALLSGCTTGRHDSASPSGATTAEVTLRWPMGSEPGSLDPARVMDIPAIEMLGQCYEGLTRFNEKNLLEPALAESWDISPDGKTYTFHLRKGVKFHNGREFVAEDVKASWGRALSPDTHSSVAANYLDGILGLKEVTEDKRKDLPGVEVVDAHTLRVTLDRPRAYFLSMLTYPSNFITCREAIAKNGGKADEKAMIGTGPFALEAYEPGSRVVFKANVDYWGGKPKVARLELPIILNPQTEYNNYETGQLDMCSTEVAQYVQDKAAGKFSDQYHVEPVAVVDYLTMNPVRQTVFADGRVRQAIAHAIDRQQILKVAFQNVGRVANGLVPPDIANAGPEPPPVPYDPAKAKQLLAEAGYPDGKGFPALTLTVRQNAPVPQVVAQLVRADLQKNLNIVVNVQERELGQFLTDASQGKMEFYMSNWYADYPDPQNFLSTLFVTKASLNRSHYSNPRFDDLCRRADAETDSHKRAALYADANRLLMEDVPVLPLDFGPRVFLVRPNVRGWRCNLCTFLPHTQTTKNPL